MFNKKSKIVTKIAVFILITTLFLWLLPVNLMFGEGEQPSSGDVGVTEDKGTIDESAQSAVEEPAVTEEGQDTLDESVLPADEGPAVTTDGQGTIDENAQSAVEEPAVTEEGQDTPDESVLPAEEVPVGTVEQGSLSEGEQPVITDVNDGNSVVVLDPKLSTDKGDYGPNETVIISGRGFAPNTDYTITVTPIGSEFNPDYFSILTNAIGSFDYDYKLNVVESLYHVRAIDADGNIVATTSFTDCHHDIFLDKSYDVGNGGEALFQLSESGAPVGSPKAANSSNGYHIVWPNLPAGHYTVAEMSGPAGYDVSITPASIDITESNWNDTNLSDEDFTFTAVNTQIKGSIKVTKSGMMPGDLVSISLLKGGVLKEAKTAGGNGDYIFTDLVLGNDYTIEEAYAGGNLYSYAAAVQTPSGSINVDSVAEVPVTLVNNPEEGSISVHKTGLEDGDTAIFSLTPLNVAPLNGRGGPYADITIAEGETKGWTGLPFGSYAVTESWSNGNTWAYNTDLSSSPVVIGSGNTDPVIDVVNKAKKGSIELFKTDQESGKALGGSTFQLWHFSTPTLIDEVALGADGHYKWENLPYGHYQVKETIAPTGYLVRDPVDVYIDPAGTLDFVLRSEIADPRIPGRIKITKVDDTGVAVAGIGFTLYDSDKSEVIRAEEKTDSAGKLTFDDLDWGTYTLSETDSLGYIAADDVKITITAAKAEAGVKVTVINTPTTPPKIVVAGLTEGVQVLAFTGIDPIIPISGGSTIAAGIAMLFAGLRKRSKYSVNHLSKKADKEGTEWWLSIL